MYQLLFVIIDWASWGSLWSFQFIIKCVQDLASWSMVQVWLWGQGLRYDFEVKGSDMTLKTRVWDLTWGQGVSSDFEEKGLRSDFEDKGWGLTCRQGLMSDSEDKSLRYDCKDKDWDLTLRTRAEIWLWDQEYKSLTFRIRVKIWIWGKRVDIWLWWY